MKKLIYYLPLVSMFAVSCNGYNKTSETLSGVEANVTETKTIPIKQVVLNLPWMDPALVLSGKGC